MIQNIKYNNSLKKVKGKGRLYAHEDIWGRGGIGPRNLGTRWR
jgi:hypothetical protein